MSKKQFLDSRLLNLELTQPVKKVKEFYRVFSMHKNEIWTTDLLDMGKYDDNGYRYILVVVDVYTRYAWNTPLKNKTATTVRDVFKAMFEDLGAPKYLWSDEGSEFYNKEMTALLKKYNVKQYSTYGDHKAMIAERYIRTLKNWIFNDFRIQRNYDWLKRLDSYTRKYNLKKHRSIGTAPIDAYLLDEEVSFSLPQPPSRDPKFKVGDHVRLRVRKSMFEKGYTDRWTTDVYTIARVFKTNPPFYHLKNWVGQKIKGGFYEEQLQKSAFDPDVFLVEKVLNKKKKINGVEHTLVKYQGYVEPEWTPTANILDIKAK